MCQAEKERETDLEIQVRTIDGVKMDELIFGSFDGRAELEPKHDTAGTWWDEEKQEMR